VSVSLMLLNIVTCIFYVGFVYDFLTLSYWLSISVSFMSIFISYCN